MGNRSDDKPHSGTPHNGRGLKRRDLLLSGGSLLAASAMAATGLDAWRGEFVVVTGVPERTTHPRTGAPLLQIVVKHPGQLRLSAVPGLPAPPSRPP